MPLHLESIMEYSNPSIVVWLIDNLYNNITDGFVQADNVHRLVSCPLRDSKTGEVIGKYVFAFFHNTELGRNEIYDLDIVLNNDQPVTLNLAKKLPESLDPNEYYEAFTIKTKQYLHVETVNRYVIERNITGTEQTVYASAFPFQLNIFDDEDSFNKFCGLGKHGIEVGKTGIRVNGLGNTFTAPGMLLDKHNPGSDTPWSIIVGKIKSYKDVTIVLGEDEYDAFIVNLETALGNLPTMVGKEMFDTSNIAVGKIIMMNTCVKIDFVKDQYPDPFHTGYREKYQS